MALDFNGTTDKLDWGDLAWMKGAAALSMLLWVNSDNVTSLRAILAKSDNTNPLLLFRSQADGSLQAIPATTAAYGVTAASVLPLTTWKHLAMVFDGAGVGNAGRLQVYVDGVLQNLTFTGTIGAAIANDTDLFRAATDAVSAFFDGRMAHLKIYNAALSKEQVQNEMRSYRPLFTNGLKIWCPLDDGTSAKDRSGNNSHPTVTGTAQVQGPPIGLGSRAFVI